MSHAKRILVIRLSAFGDIILCLGAMAAIRRAHPNAHITWMTTAPFVRLAEGSGNFDAVWPVARWKWWQLREWRGFVRRLQREQFELVYDLQRNDRTRFFRRLAPASLQRHWYAYDTPPPGVVDTRDILAFPKPDIGWMGGDAARFGIAVPYALLVPGSAPQHPYKRWPHYDALAQRIAAQGITPVAVGTEAERSVIDGIKAGVPQLVALTGQTSLGDIAALANGAAATIGNDTGPMHVVALTECPIISLFSGKTDPAVCAPRGNTLVLREPNIGDITVEQVWQAFKQHKR